MRLCCKQNQSDGENKLDNLSTDLDPLDAVHSNTIN